MDDERIRWEAGWLAGWLIVSGHVECDSRRRRCKEDVKKKKQGTNHQLFGFVNSLPLSVEFLCVRVLCVFLCGSFCAR